MAPPDHSAPHQQALQSLIGRRHTVQVLDGSTGNGHDQQQPHQQQQQQCIDEMGGCNGGSGDPIGQSSSSKSFFIETNAISRLEAVSAAGELSPPERVASAPRHGGLRHSSTSGSLSGSRRILSFDDSKANRSGLNNQRVAAILKNFKFFQEMDESVQQKLPAIANHVRYPEGTILFRQGDAPGNCYAILSGEVGIYVKSEEEDHVDSARARHSSCSRKSHALAHANTVQWGPGTPTNNSATASTASNGPSPTSQLCSPPTAGAMGTTVLRSGLNTTSPLAFGERMRASSLSSLQLSSEMAERTQDTITSSSRKRTVEGFSTYHDGSAIGKRCSVFGPGKLFGELALLGDQPRSATIKCMKDAEFLVICRREFDQVLKEELAQANAQKIKFLREHVPGMQELPLPKPGGRPHASYFFKKACFGKDHEFLTQGIAAEDVLYVLCKGAVEFRRYEAPDGMLNRGAPPSRKGRQKRRVMRSWTPSQKLNVLVEGGEEEAMERTDKEDYVRKMGIMLAGSVFGPLPVMEPEPFTVAACTQCEVLAVSVQDFPKLPGNLRLSIQEHLANMVAWRLARLQSDRLITLKEPAVRKEDRDKLPKAAETYGLGLMRVGKIHPHPALLKCHDKQQYMDMIRAPSRGGLSTSESLPSMSQNTSVMSLASGTSSRGSMRSQGRPRSQHSSMDCPTP